MNNKIKNTINVNNKNDDFLKKWIKKLKNSNINSRTEAKIIVLKKEIENNNEPSLWITGFFKINDTLKETRLNFLKKKSNNVFEDLIKHILKLENYINNYEKDNFNKENNKENNKEKEIKQALRLMHVFLDTNYKMNFSKKELLNISDSLKKRKNEFISKYQKQKISTQAEATEFFALWWLIFLFPNIKIKFLKAAENKDIYFASKYHLKNDIQKPDIRIGKEYYEITTTIKIFDKKITNLLQKKNKEEKSRLKYKYVFEAIEKKYLTKYNVEPTYFLNLCIFQDTNLFWKETDPFLGFKWFIKKHSKKINIFLEKFENIYIFDEIWQTSPEHIMKYDFKYILLSMSFVLNKSSIEKFKKIKYKKLKTGEFLKNFLRIIETKQELIITKEASIEKKDYIDSKK